MNRRIHLPLIALSAIIFLGSSEVGATTQRTIERLEEDIAELQSELDRISGKSEEISAMAANIEVAESEIEETSKRLRKLESEIKEMEFLNEIYKKSFRVQSELAPGDPVGSLDIDGENISGAVFLGTVEDGAKIQTSNGVIVISSNDMPVELSEKFSLPPAIPAPDATFESLMAIKPDELLSEKEIALASAAEERSREDEEEAAENSAAKKAEIAKKNEAIHKEIESLKKGRSELYQEKRRIEAARLQKDREFRRATVKKAQVHVDAVLGEYDSKIESIAQQRKQMFDRIKQLRDQLQY